MKRVKRHIIRVLTLLLLFTAAAHQAWATDVTYHILTLPIDSVNRYNYHMKDIVHGWRLEAVKVVQKSQSTLELPAQYKSPLATDFKYYKASDVTKYSSGTAQNLFDNGPIKGVLYRINGENTPTTEDDATPVAEGSTLPSGSVEYYVVYTYDASNTIAQLDGNVRYNIRTKYKDKGEFKDKGFIAYNRGRNNRPAVLPTANVDPEMLASEDFMVASVDGTKVSTYWQSNDNKNNKADVESQFHFMFKFEGKDPYNIIIRTAYAKDSTYIEKNDGTNNFVYKWYKEGSLFASSNNNNCYIASDEHKKYTQAWVDGSPNPINPAYKNRFGNYHCQTGVMWNSVALLPNTDNSGYVFMGTRTVDANGAINNTLYYLKEKDTYNNLYFTGGNSSDNLSIEGIYPIKKVTFKVATPFYDPESPTAHIVSVADQVSQYTVNNDPIETKYLPEALKRKYCTFNGKFYSDATCETEITHFSQANFDVDEGYQVYVGYDVAASAPFKSISPSASYTTATWYELTDEGSVQESGRKIKWDATNEVYKNNGANGEYVKESEFAFVGDPYELKVLYRKGTEDAKANTYVTLSTNNSWDIPADATDGSFLLRKFNDTGYWSWNPGQVSTDVAYESSSSSSVDKNAHTVTINLSGLNTSKYYKITTGGAGASQIVSVTPSANNVRKVPGTTMTIVVKLAENTSGADKVMTVTIQEYNDGEGNTTFGSPSVITITQDDETTTFAGNEVTYSTTNSTRVKVLELPTRTFTYHIVDKSGRIAVKASAEQTVFSKLSLASIPSIIVSPFILDETVTFYDSYTDRNSDGVVDRRDFHNPSEQTAITETPNTDHDFFVTYTTANLDNKPINLSEDQEFNVVLNGEYLYYDSSDGGSIKSNAAPTAAERSLNAYLWKLRNKDPYHMLIDNLGAREVLPNPETPVAGETESVIVYNDDGSLVEPTPTRQKGAWVKLAAALGNDVALTFDTDRANAQLFIAKSGLQPGVYEVMVAAGAGIDASETYYDIGRTSATDIKIYDNEHYIHGNDELKFQLEQTIDYSYHLIDKYDHELLKLTSQSPDLVFPAEYQSPLVETYHYYDIGQFTITDDVYTLNDNPTALTKMSDLDATATNPETSNAEAYNAADTNHKHEDATTVEQISEKAKKLRFTGNHYYKISDYYYVVNVTKPYYTDIYVTYDINDRVKFDKSSPYMLKFLQPHAGGYYLENGNDQLTTDKIEAVYPYCNGDGSLNIYGEEMQKEQFNGGASTRPRWIWYFESEKKDPYHVMIHSSNTISYNGTGHPTYLQTFAVDFVQGATTPKHIVTCGTLPTIASEDITEYMVLGTVEENGKGHYKLRTTYAINDGTSEMRRDITSLEQYWKTYNMIKLDVLGVDKGTDAYSTDEKTWVVPTEDDPKTVADESTYRTMIEAKDWHSYAVYANAVRWNGYNDKSDGHEKKCVEKIEHWFQTFEMGDGTFDIESASIPPVLVLLDLHGWEIMRQPLPGISTYPDGEELAALRAYDSPMVDKYYFYSNATKATGCHKYSLRLNDKGEERDTISYEGKQWSSSSLGDLPPITAKGVMSNGVLNDQYVVYTVKEEYAKSYDYEFTPTGTDTYTESGTASKFLILLGSRFFRDLGTVTSYFSKPIYEASNPVGGNVYDMILSPQTTTISGVSTQVDSNGDGKIDDINLWYVQPNLNIDKEMGIKYATTAGNTGEPWTEFETKKYYDEKGKSGFDPYNIQLKNANNGKFVTTHQTSTSLHDGILIGDYSGGGTTDMTLADGYDYTGWNPLTVTGSEGYDHTNLTISNQTFMAVSDVNDNMQLMPRFDHKKRVNLVNNAADSFTTLQDPENHAKASAADNSSMGTQTAFFVRSQVFEYKIIDNDGNESIRYKRSGDYYPAITDHFKSPLAKDFTYYTGLAEHGATESSSVSEWGPAADEYKKTATTETLMNSLINLLPTAGTYYFRIGTRGVFDYKKVVVTKGLSEKQITGSFADAGLSGDDCNVIVRYDYDADTDHDGDRILEGKWFTVKLANKDLQSSGTVDTTVGDTQGTGVYLYAGNESTLGDDNDKPAAVDADDMKWQWKFRTAPADPSSDYYEAPDPYAIHIFNREANYTTNPSLQPSPMAVGIKVPNEASGADRFALLSHSDGGYALAVAGTEEYTYDFVNGASMTTSVAATTVTETDFTQKAGIFNGVGSQLLVNDDVEHHFEYRVINNASKFAVNATQDNAAADAHQFFPYLPEAAQTHLLNMEDYQYYGFANHVDATDTYNVIPQTILYTLYGLYDDVVWVRYGAYDMDKTEFKIPNKKAIVDSHVAKDPTSVDASMNIEGELPYNIIWYNDDMMKADGSSISKDANQDLSGDAKYVWLFENNDPYNLKIKHKNSAKFIYSSDESTCTLDGSNSTSFMLLKKTGYDYGILQVTGGTKALSGYGNILEVSDATHPNKFIIFGLSVHDLIYHLIIARTCTDSEKSSPAADQYVDIPYRATESGTLTTLRIFGSTQRDLTSGTPAGATYQLGSTETWGGTSHTYSHDAGAVSIGDVLEVPNVFNRPNCTFEYYIEGVYDSSGETSESTLDGKYKGLKLKNLMSDPDLINKTVVVNIVYSFDKDVATNTGMDFVRSINDKCWYTFETPDGTTPYLAHYTNAWGLQCLEGRETRYSNDYLWTPLGDVYGFKLYNRYMIKNSDGSDKVMTFDGTVSEGKNLAVAKPGSTVEAKTYTEGNEIFELISSDKEGEEVAYFRVHPVVNTKEQTQYYVKRDASDRNYAKLSTTPGDWSFALDMSLMEPYYERAGYVGGLTAEGKEAYETALSSGTIMDIQHVVFDDDNIITFTPGYYRLHNQPGVSGISPVRYASGYLHETEKTAVSGGIPMHFYSKAGVTGTFDGDTNPLRSGFTETPATRGDIPIPATEYDPSTIFYINGSVTGNKTISTATMSTQGQNVLGNKMTEGAGTTFTFIDIGGATLLIADELDPATRQYFSFDQRSNIYDLKFAHEVPTDDAKWCLQPVQKTATAGNGEVPLNITTNDGGDSYYYTTFYAPYDVLLPENGEGNTYNAYYCKKWHVDGVNPVPVPAYSSYDEGKFVPAGTPVIIRTNDESESMTLTLPSTTPSASPVSGNIFKGKYLEQMLGSGLDVYTLGLPFISSVTKKGDYETTGDLIAPLPEQAKNGVGFYINATSNKENNGSKARWDKNNRYVIHNKIYYRETGAGARANFVPLLFDDPLIDDKFFDPEEPPVINDPTVPTPVLVGDVYDLMGRRVATAQQVLDGTWKLYLPSGVYIIGGKKVMMKRGN